MTSGHAIGFARAAMREISGVGPMKTSNCLEHFFQPLSMTTRFLVDMAIGMLPSPGTATDKP